MSGKPAPSGSGAAEAARALLSGGKGSGGSTPMAIGGKKGSSAETPQNTPVTPNSGFKEFEKKKGFSSAPVPLGAAGGQVGATSGDAGSAAAGSPAGFQDPASTPQNTPISPSPLSAPGGPFKIGAKLGDMNVTVSAADGAGGAGGAGGSGDLAGALAAKLSGLTMTDEDGNEVTPSSAQLDAMMAHMSRAATTKAIDDLPAPVRPRIWALKNLQSEYDSIAAEFRKEAKELELKYEGRYAPLYAKRKSWVTGESEPSADEARKPADEEGDDAAPAAGEEAATGGPTIIGVPGFWLRVLQQCSETATDIEEHDIPALESLVDIYATYDSPAPAKEDKGGDDGEDSEDGESEGWSLTFVFAPNDYFTNTELTKRYVMQHDEQGDAMLASVEGTDIDWKPGKNLTVGTVEKKQKHKTKGKVRTITAEEPRDSFFNFFSPPDPTEDMEEDESEEVDNLLYMDYEIGMTIRDRLIPKAVLYFTGELADADSDDDLDEDGDEDDSDDDDDSDGEPARGGGRRGGRGGRGRGGGGRGGGRGGGQQGLVPGKNADCKQQ